MRSIAKILGISAALLLLAGCGAAVQESAATGTNESESISEEEESKMEQENNLPSEESTHTESESAASETTGSTAEKALSDYTNEQIEYARVWRQLGPNQELEELYVQRIPAGTPLNPDDETSGVYPEDVIQLAGSRLVDGSITYSGNGDGTINVYNVPLRWDGNYPAGEDFYAEIISNTELVAVDPGNDEEIIRLIRLLHAES